MSSTPETTRVTQTWDPARLCTWNTASKVRGPPQPHRTAPSPPTVSKTTIQRRTLIGYSIALVCPLQASTGRPARPIRPDGPDPAHQLAPLGTADRARRGRRGAHGAAGHGAHGVTSPGHRLADRAGCACSTRETRTGTRTWASNGVDREGFEPPTPCASWKPECSGRLHWTPHTGRSGYRKRGSALQYPPTNSRVDGPLECPLRCPLGEPRGAEGATGSRARPWRRTALR